MNGKKTGFLVISQLLLLIAYIPLSLFFTTFVYVRVGLPFDLWIDPIIALVPLILILTPMIYGARQAKGAGGPIGLFIISYAIVMTACGALLRPPGFSVFAPVLLPKIIINGVRQGTTIGPLSLIIAVMFCFIMTISLWRLRHRKLALAAIPPVFMLVFWFSAEGLFSYSIPKAAKQQFGSDYCITFLGSAMQSLKYGGTPSMYRHAELIHEGRSFHWSFKAKTFVPEDHWISYGPKQNQCASGSHYAKNYKHW